jgi:hypothetical protein
VILTAEKYAGIPVFIDEKLDRAPRMKVSAEFANLMPPEFVADLNAWMVDFFGTERVIYRTPTAVMMGPVSWSILKRMTG